MKNRKLLLINSLLITLYLFIAIPYFIIEGDSLEGHPIFGALYFILVIGHGGFMTLAVILQWLGVVTKSRGWVIFANWMLLLSGIFLIFPLIGIIPVIILNRVALGRKKQIE